MPTRFFGAVAALVVSSFFASASSAEDMDLQLSRLSTGNCQATLGDSPVLRTGGDQALTADNDAWRKLISQASPVLMLPVLAPVTTSGPRGVDVSLQTSVVGITEGAGYWERGSEGHGPNSDPTCDGRNRFVAGSLTQNRLVFAKGLPLGFTLGAQLGRIWNTSLWTIGGSLKWALFEGYPKLPVPDLAVRASGATAVGDAQFSLTTVNADVVLSKNIVAGSVVELAPYLGAGLSWTFASSELIDLTPNVDSVACAAGTDPRCPADGSTDDVGHDVPFDDLALMRSRGFAGLMFRYRIFSLAAELTLDALPPSSVDKQAGAGLPRQWTFSVAPALSY